MGFIPHQLSLSHHKGAPPRIVEAACQFCADRPAELYQLPTFGLAAPGEPPALVCGDCFRQITFTSPRPAARVVLAQR